MTNEQIVIRIKAGIDVAKNMLTLWEENQALIKMIVKQYDKGETEDLMQEAYIGLCDAVDGYKPEMGVKFMSYAPYRIKTRVRRYLFANNPFGVPEYMQELIKKDRRMTAAFLQQLGRNPTDRERMKNLHLTRKQLESLDKAKDMRLGSMDTPTGEDENGTLYDITEGCAGIEDAAIDDMVLNDLNATLWGMVDSLPKQEAAAIRGRFQKNLTYQQCGDMIGITRDRARSVEAKGLRTLRHPKNSNKLKPFLDGYEVIRAEGIKGTGVGRFENTWTSATERVALGIGSSFLE